MGRADGTPDELATAVRADAVQDVLGAVAAPGAFVGADKHVRGCRVEVPVAALAIRPQLQPRYAGYAQKTDRAIPVIRLSRAD